MSSQTAPIAGNQFVLPTQNLAGQLNNLNAASGERGSVSVNSLTVSSASVPNVKPSLEGLTVTAQTGTPVTYAAGINTSDFDGSAAPVIVTLPAATSGTVVVHAQSVVTDQGVNALQINCAGTDTFVTGSVLPSSAGNNLAFNAGTTSVAGDNRLTFTPAAATTNLLNIGSNIYFVCTSNGLWHVSADVQPSNANITGTFGFSTA